MDLFEAMYTTRSIRHFRAEPVPDDLVRRVIEAGTQAPSGTNAQSWRFVVVRDPEKRRRVGELYREGFFEVYSPDRVVGETEPGRRRVLSSAQHLAEHMGDEPPVLVLVCLERGRTSPPVTRTAGSSAYPAVQNMLLAARALGLGACLTTLHIRREEAVKTALGIPEHVDTYALIPLGWPARPYGPLGRRPVEEVTYLDDWGSPWSSSSPD